MNKIGTVMNYDITMAFQTAQHFRCITSKFFSATTSFAVASIEALILDDQLQACSI